MNLEDLGKLNYNDKNFETVLGFVGQIQSAKKPDGDDDDGMYTVGLMDLREDRVEPSLPRELALQNAKEHDAQYFIVPLVVE